MPEPNRLEPRELSPTLWRYSGPKQWAHRALYEFKTLVARYPGVALPAARWRGHGVVVGPGTDVLIEGYPRSANSFAVAAFGQAQPGPVRIAHHTHAPGHVVAAARMGIPAMVLIREPEEAVLEFVLVKPNLSVGQALRGYLRFYGPLLAHRDSFVVGPFPEVTTDFGKVMARLNERFGRDFVPFEHSEQNVRACFEAMDGYWRGRTGPGLPVVGRTEPPLPSEPGDDVREGLRSQYWGAALDRSREGARRLHQRFLRGAA
jgi:hypothetical protein